MLYTIWWLKYLQIIIDFFVLGKCWKKENAVMRHDSIFINQKEKIEKEKIEKYVLMESFH